MLKEWIDSQKDLSEHREEEKIETEKWGMYLQRGQVVEDNRKVLVLSLSLSLSLEKSCCAVSFGGKQAGLCSGKEQLQIMSTT